MAIRTAGYTLINNETIGIDEDWSWQATLSWRGQPLVTVSKGRDDEGNQAGTTIKTAYGASDPSSHVGRLLLSFMGLPAVQAIVKAYYRELEDPENGVHPRTVRELADENRDINGRFIVTASNLNMAVCWIADIEERLRVTVDYIATTAQDDVDLDLVRYESSTVDGTEERLKTYH